MQSLHPLRARTVDVARRSGYSVQQVRNLERDGVLPTVRRGPSGYRQYEDFHVHILIAYRSLAAAIGPVDAKQLLRQAREAPVDDTLAALDAVHARLHGERAGLSAARKAARYIAAESIGNVHDQDWMSVGELASALGVRPSTLRYWDAEGLVVPDRRSPAGARRYSPEQVRDARIVHQLRTVGQRIESVRELMPALRAGLRESDLAVAFAARQESITRRSHALLDAAAALRLVLPR